MSGNFSKINQLVKNIASQSEVTIPAGYKYRYAPYSCYKCGKDILIFKWGNSLLAGEVEKPPLPMPETLKQRHTNMSGETYWANVCPYCDSVQGDFFINHEPDSPLFGLGDVVDTKESFETDMENIANYYYQNIRDLQD